MRRTNGFTLVELLVVVTIIVVLLALLVPAMDKAIYQTELAQCSANQRATGVGIYQYAMDNKRLYPYRPGKRGSNLSNRRLLASPSTVYPGGGVELTPDDRPYLVGYVSLNKHMVDPFHSSLKLDLEDSDPTVWIWASYNLFYGFQHGDNKGKMERGMFKLGDWVEFTPYPDQPTDRYDLLTGDFDEVIPSASNTWSSHPDIDTDILSLQGGNRVNELGQPTTYGRYKSFETDLRGPLDLNFQRTDLSVHRYDGLIYEANPDGSRRRDDRLDLLPQAAMRTAGNQWAAGNGSHVPKR